MIALEESGERPVRKRCVFCGSGPMTLSWRPTPEPDLRVFSSPLDESPWWPENWVRDAKLRCSKCRNLSYGRLVGGHVTADGMVTGEFMTVLPGQLEIW